MMGVNVASKKLSVLPPGVAVEGLHSKVDALMEKSHIVFGLNHAASFRLTEIRMWACERSEDDIKMMMREYLTAAESRKKFRVKIKKGAAKGGVGMLAPPKGGGKGLFPPKGGSMGLSPSSGLLPPKSGGIAPPKGGLLLPPKAGLLAPPRDRKDSTGDDALDSPSCAKDSQTGAVGDSGTAGFSSGFSAFDTTGVQEEPKNDGQSSAQESKDEEAGWDGPAYATDDEKEDNKESPKQSLWDGAVPLSQQVRSSAAAALIRGPPATRHFGGNRGGCPDLRGADRFVFATEFCGVSLLALSEHTRGIVSDFSSFLLAL